MMRIVRGLFALAVLAGSVLVAPWLLVSWGRYPAPGELGPDRLLLVPDDGRVLLWLLTGLGWTVWLLFTLSVAAEVVGTFGGRSVRLPGLRWMQLASGTLLLAVLVMLGAGQWEDPTGGPGDLGGPAPAVAVAVAYAAPADPVERDAPATTETPVAEQESVEAAAPEPARPETFEYRVQRGDDLWTLAETHLGDGLEWRRIRDLNPQLLRHDPDHLEVGWVLTLPLPATAETSPPEPAPEAEAPAPAVEAEPAPVTPADPAPTAEAAVDPDRERSVALGGIGALAAAGIVAGLAGRRHLQLVQRPVGRVPQRPGEGAERLRTALLATGVPAEVEVVEWAVHMVARHALRTGNLPALDRLRVGRTEVEFVWDRDREEGADEWIAGPPPPFARTGWSWVVARAEVVADRAGSPGEELLRPWPTLVSLGTGENDDTYLVDLERWGRLSVQADSAERAGEILTSYVLDLVTGSWAGAARVVVVGDDGGLVDTSGVEHVRRVDDLDDIITTWEATTATQQSLVAVADAPVPVLRLDPDFAEAWSPQVVVLLADITPAQRRRLGDRFARTHRGPIVLVSEHPGGEASLLVDESPLRARFEPAGLALTPQRVARRTRDEVVELHRITAPDALVSAPWAGGHDVATSSTSPSATLPFATLVTTATPTLVEEEPPMSDDPRLLLLGPIELEGARGAQPSRAPRQCLEYCAWLLEHPNATSVEMARALLVAESTRRSNMSRLRGWLGTSADGRPYLPEAYSGRIRLHPAVRSDWQEVQVLLGRGIPQTSSATLAAILDLVRGAPLADAPPGDWTWAEELRIESACAVRDVADELAGRALDEQDLDLAKWAIGRGLVAAPADELLLRRLLVAEHRSGNTRGVERLVFTLNKQAHTLGIDLLPETVITMQEVLEGGIRIRTAGGPRRAAV